jgi:hypothetical protein
MEIVGFSTESEIDPSNEDCQSALLNSLVRGLKGFGAMCTCSAADSGCARNRPCVDLIFMGN